MSEQRKPRRRFVDSRSTDQEFDELLPQELRHLSRVHWTPISAAIRAAKLLCPAPDMRILDVGSGIGKLCIVGAMSSPSAWCGVERHETLVTAARKLSRSLGVGDQTLFVHGDAFSLDWTTFDSLYFYNPFEVEVETGDAAMNLVRHRLQVAETEERLAALPEGTRVVTLNGFGGSIPSSFRLAYHEVVSIMEIDLVLWIQGAPSVRRRPAS